MSLMSRRAGTALASMLLVALTLVLLLGPGSGRVRGDRERWLLKVPTTSEVAVARLADEGARPVLVTPDYTLVLATPAEELLPALRQAGAMRIAPWNPEAPTFLVFPKPAAPQAPAPESFGRILDRTEHALLLETDAAGAERLPEHYRVVRLLDRPLRFGPGLTRGAGEARRDRAVVHDPGIQAMVNQVDIPTMQSKINALVAFGTRRSNTTGGVNAQNWLVQQFQAMGYTDVTLHNYNAWSDNVICVKPGVATPDQIYVIGGHYDSISNVSGNAPGADDNATGTVGVLEAARILAPFEFQSTIYFCAWSGEEEGLVGSDAWATEAALAGLDIKGYLNLDMEGYLSQPKDLDLVSNGASAWLHDVVFEAVPLYVPTLSVVEGSIPMGASSDHASFWNAGYHAVFFFEDSDNYSPYIHTTNDVVGLSLNNYDFMKENVQAAVAVLATLAEPFTIALTHTPLGDTEVTDQPYPVVAEIVGAAPLVADSLRVRYRVNGDTFTWLTMLPTGGANEYRALIPAQPAGSNVEYYVRARDAAGHVKNLPADAPAGLYAFMTGIQLAFADGAETDRGWSFTAAGDNATSGLWLRADPVATDYQPENDHTIDPGHLCFVTGNGPAGGANGEQDIDGGRTTLTSPVFSLQGASWAKISYWRWYVDATTLDDDFTVTISNDGGATWHPLEVVPQSAYPWVLGTFPNLGATLPLTAQMRVRFVAEDIGVASLVEAAIDDFLVTGVFVDPAAVEPGPATRVTRLWAARPNPTSGTATLVYELAQSSPVDLTVFDVQGRRVQGFALGAKAAGTHVAAWDGRDESGRRVPAGVYLVKLAAGEERSETRVTILD